jgi:hypothetical protein
VQISPGITTAGLTIAGIGGGVAANRFLHRSGSDDGATSWTMTALGAAGVGLGGAFTYAGLSHMGEFAKHPAGYAVGGALLAAASTAMLLEAL